MSTVDAVSGTGIDIGSRTTKIVRVRDGMIVDAVVFETGHSPAAEIDRAARNFDGGPVVATGYGRKLAGERLSCRTVTEIRACARGARHLSPSCTGAIDIGGQDTKALEVVSSGGFGRFEMNDRCAAGTGRFLEVMAKTLGYSVETFGREALKADVPAQVNSMCTVFAESEVVSMISRGEARARIALGLHIATARRVAAMASRLDMGERILFAGGVANNPCIVAMLREEVKGFIDVPERPELVVALGAALIGIEECRPAGGCG